MLLTRTQEDALALKAKLFRGLGDPSRLAILAALADGPRTVTEIVEATGLKQPNASTHLSCLHDCALVARERDGRHVRYQIADPQVHRVLASAEGVLQAAAENLQACTRYDADPEP